MLNNFITNQQVELPQVFRLFGKPAEQHSKV